MISSPKYTALFAPQNVFLFLALLFGLLFIAITPPFQVPDEREHFFRAWQISEGTFVSEKKDNRVGGELPSSIGPFGRSLNSIVDYAQKINPRDYQRALEMRIDSTDRTFVDFNNTALYSFVCYAPASVGIFLLRTLDMRLMYIFYGARLFNLIFWSIILFFAIKKMLVFKWLMVALSLLPMSVWINSSLSADVVTNAVCFSFMAYIFYLAYGNQAITRKQIILLSLFVFLVVSVKSIYAPLILLVGLIPQSSFQNKKIYFQTMCMLLLIGIAAAVLWSSLISDLYLSYDNYNPEYRAKVALIAGADVGKQFDFIKSNDLYILNVIINSFSSAFNMYFFGYIGVFGWLEVPLPHWCVYLIYTSLFLLCIFGSERGVNIKWQHRLLFGASFLLIFILLIVSQHLVWDPIGSEAVGTIQGRYLIPFVPLLFFIFYFRNIEPKKIIICLCLVIAILVLCYSSYLIADRYFPPMQPT